MVTEFAPRQKATGSHFHVHHVALAAALTALSLTCADAWALGLGRLNVQSALGEPLRAEIDVTAMSPQEASSLKARVASSETYRAAGVDYNQVLAVAQISLQRRADGRPFLRLSSERAVTEPFVDAILDLQWASGRLVREYTLLFDPPSLARSSSESMPPLPTVTAVEMDPPEPEPVPRVPEAVAAPVATPAQQDSTSAAAAAPAESPKPTESKEEVEDELAAESAPKPQVSRPSVPATVTPVAKPAVAVAPKPAAVSPVAPKPESTAADSSDQKVRVRAGDSLSQLAEKTLQPGVSLDQMMVGLYRGNPQAFLDNNMNRLKSGVVLKVPSAQATQAISPDQAKQVIVAQSADFEAFRQRLASGATAAVVPAQQRQVAGKVEAEVTDRKQTQAPKPDKLTLSKGGMSTGKPVAAAEDRIAQNRAKQDSNTRVAELSRNLDALNKLKEQVAKPVAPAAPVVTKPAPVVVAPVPTPVKKPIVSDDVLADDDSDLDSPVPASAADTPAADTAARVASAAAAATLAADMATQVASAPAEAVAPVVAVPMSVPDVASMPVVANDDSATGSSRTQLAMLAGAGALLALGAGGWLFWRSRRRHDGAETSFLESRLQPDSFFGASGGQRVDTRDAASPSSMSYSLSQLDAIGDVDPVAEADVYLAYGRDLQAEEILKEALRTSPERPAVRAKLIEVYAKRRDTKGVEHVAKELWQITQGVGPDWQRAQELGLSVDPTNPLYQTGQSSAETLALAAPVAEMDRTLPMSAMPAASAAIHELADHGEIDLDISLPPTPEMMGSVDSAAQRLDSSFARASSAVPAEMSIDFDLPVLPAATAAEAKAVAEVPAQAAAPFDLSTISLDLDDDATVIKVAKPAAAPVPEFVASNPVPMDVVNDPMMRKVELAHEFMQIGDVDGAKDLLKEVMTDGQEVSRAKARELLDRLT